MIDLGAVQYVVAIDHLHAGDGDVARMKAGPAYQFVGRDEKDGEYRDRDDPKRAQASPE
jgi:hypothetical protein